MGWQKMAAIGRLRETLYDEMTADVCMAASFKTTSQAALPHGCSSYGPNCRSNTENCCQGWHQPLRHSSSWTRALESTRPFITYCIQFNLTGARMACMFFCYCWVTHDGICTSGSSEIGACWRAVSHMYLKKEVITAARGIWEKSYK